MKRLNDPLPPDEYTCRVNDVVVADTGENLTSTLVFHLEIVRGEHVGKEIKVQTSLLELSTDTGSGSQSTPTNSN